MLEKIKRLTGRSTSRPDARPVLENLARGLRQESARRLTALASRSADPHPVNELYIALDNLTNCDAQVRRNYFPKATIDAESALAVIDEEIRGTTNLIRTGVVSGSLDAGEVVMQTLNLLFTAKQKVKQEFGVITALDIDNSSKDADAAKQESSVRAEISKLPLVPQMTLPAAMIFQMRQSLFPAERMIVGAARRTARNIAIEALFDVTGEASPGGVKADPDRLGQALIAMSETGTYFGLWIHSHPGTGAGATHPSRIDVRQHADWLKDYSPELVSAIMVSDQYIRFWGTAVESGTVAIAVGGDGITLISQEERIYRIGS